MDGKFLGMHQKQRLLHLHCRAKVINIILEKREFVSRLKILKVKILIKSGQGWRNP